MKAKKLIIFFLLVFFSISSKAGDREDYIWWNNFHNWDGCRSWMSYLTTSAAYFGPNALPVPVLNDGLISGQYVFEFRPEAHFSDGDNTFNLYTSLKIPLAERVDFEVFIVPFEYFSMDTATRNIRAVRHIDASGIEGGDFWFGTDFMILKETKQRPQLVVSAYFKTASGTGLDYARYTDASGYYTTLTAGKNLMLKKPERKLRLFAQTGFYAYQTWGYLHNQDDCISYGAGFKYEFSKIWFRAVIAGYFGYLNNGDRPSVVRFQAGTKNKHLNFALKYQGGIHDYKYQAIGLSVIYSFGKTPD